MNMHTLTREELNRLVQTLPDDPQQRAALALMTVEGLRFGDVVRARWSGYAPDEDGTPCLAYQGKTGREQRRLDPVTAAALDALHAAAGPGEEIVPGLDEFGARWLLFAHADRAGVRLSSPHAVRYAVRGSVR